MRLTEQLHELSPINNLEPLFVQRLQYFYANALPEILCEASHKNSLNFIF